MAQMVKNLPATWETQVWSLVGKIPWGKSWQPTLVFLLWRIPWTEEPGKLCPRGQKELDATERLTLSLLLLLSNRCLKMSVCLRLFFNTPPPGKKKKKRWDGRWRPGDCFVSNLMFYIPLPVMAPIEMKWNLVSAFSIVDSIHFTKQCLILINSFIQEVSIAYPLCPVLCCD